MCHESYVFYQVSQVGSDVRLAEPQEGRAALWVKFFKVLVHHSLPASAGQGKQADKPRTGVGSVAKSLDKHMGMGRVTDWCYAFDK